MSKSTSDLSTEEKQQLALGAFVLSVIGIWMYTTRNKSRQVQPAPAPAVAEEEKRDPSAQPRRWQQPPVNYTAHDDFISCTGNYGNVAAQSQFTFTSNDQKTFTIQVNTKQTKHCNKVRIGIVADSLLDHQDCRKDYWCWEYPNAFLGMKSDGFNLGIDLKGNCATDGHKDKKEPDVSESRDIMTFRVVIGGGVAKFFCRGLWGRRNRKVIELPSDGNLRLAVVGSKGTGFTLSEIPALRPVDMDPLDDAESECAETIKWIQDATKGRPVNIVMIGRQGAGKSSFINTALTAFTPGISQIRDEALVGDDGIDHITTVFIKYQLPGTNVSLLDTIGFRQKKNDVATHTYNEIMGALLRGEINEGCTKDGLEMDAKERENDMPGFHDESMDRRMRNDGAIFVADAGGDMDEWTRKVFREFKQANGNLGRSVPMVGIVTKLDKLCKYPKEFEWEMLQNDPQIIHAFRTVKTQLKMPDTSPVICYDTQKDNEKPDARVNLVVLRQLKKIITKGLIYKKREFGSHERVVEAEVAVGRVPKQKKIHHTKR